VYDLPRRLFPNVVPVTAEAIDVARRLLDGNKDIMARDALHAAVVRIGGFEALCSYDPDFDRIAGLVRREPGGV
jgi:predicted nucleic acid-binding protein